MIKVLHIVSTLGGGGVGMMIYNYYSHMNKADVKFDFIVHGDEIGILEPKIEALGATIFHVPRRKVNLKENIKDTTSIIKLGQYDMVHCHLNQKSFIPLYIAKKNGLSKCILHSHGCIPYKNKVHKIIDYIMRKASYRYSDYYFADSIDAGKWLYGGNWSINEENLIMSPAIDTNVFFYDIEKRENYREKMNISDKLVLLHVGRFTEEKNHSFMLEIIERLPEQYILMFAGDGANEDSIKVEAKRRGIYHRIIFLGIRTDISSLMNASDIFIFPSKNEGFGMVAIEAQATGLKVLASIHVPRATKISELIKYLPIDDVKGWVDAIMKTHTSYRVSKTEEVDKYGYSDSVQAQKYMSWLKNHV